MFDDCDGGVDVSQNRDVLRGADHTCTVCGCNFAVLNPKQWIYKTKHGFQCSYSCHNIVKGRVYDGRRKKAL